MKTGSLEEMQKVYGVLIASNGDGTYTCYEELSEVPEKLYQAVFAPTPALEEADTDNDGIISAQEQKTWWDSVKNFFGFRS